MLPLTLCWAVLAAIFDGLQRRIPNTLSLGACLVGVGVMGATGHSVMGGTVSSALWAGAVALLLTLPAYAWRKLGAGDVKLLTAMGLLTDLPMLLNTFVVAAFAGGLMVMWVIAGRALPVFIPGLWHAVKAPVPSASNQRPLPYGIALTAGFAASLWMARAA